MKYVWVALLVSNFCFGQKKMVFNDAVYEDNIRTVFLYGSAQHDLAPVRPAVAQFIAQNLVLEFDDIQENRNNYYVRLIHCNYNWTPSSLKDLDFMSVYNEFNINEYEFSQNTYLPFIHYRFLVPPVKLPGNYLLMVYRDGDRSDVVLTKRMMITDQRVNFLQDNTFAGSGNLNAQNQQINFTIDYGTLRVFNALEDFHVVIRQNQRWDNARMDVKPSFVREDRNQVEYRFFDEDKHWAAGNEFRFVDFRSLISPGQNTGSINRSVKPFELKVRTDLTREGLAYGQYRDGNGNFTIENLDYPDATVSSQYVFADFSLAVPELPNASVYVIGRFNDWARTAENKMKYNKSKGQYDASIVLKQGFYDYQYYVDSPTLPAWHFEGSHFQTENVYEVFVYWRSLQPMADMLVGYYTVPVNPR
jgi:hypothetical protein